MKAVEYETGGAVILIAFGLVLLSGFVSLPFATASGTVSVYPAMAVSASATPSSGSYPLSVTLSSYTTGGSGTGYTDSWTDGAGHTSNLAVWTTTYTAAGTFTATVTVTDSVGNKGTGSTTVTVGSPLVLTCTFSPNILIIGQAVTVSCSTSGGTSYYGWSATYGDGANSGAQAVTSAASYSFSHAYSAAGTYTITVTGTAGLTSTGTCPGYCASVVGTFALGASGSSSSGLTTSQYAGVGSMAGGVLLLAFAHRKEEE